MRIPRRTLAALIAWALVSGTAAHAPAAAAEQRGPVIVSRSNCDPSIHEGLPDDRVSAGLRRDVTPLLGLLPASYEWFIGIARALGSRFQPGAIDPTYLGYQSGQRVGYDFLGPIGFKRDVSRLAPGAKGIGGKNVTDVPRLGVPGRQCPGDPYWVAFPRPGNVEIPPPYQFVHYDWDCYCRYDELVACPTGVPPPLGLPIDRPGLNLHEFYGGRAPFIPCHQCFGLHNIRKHDYLVGTKKGPHEGYSRMAWDSGYQECLRQSVESYAASGPGGQPQVPDLYGL